MALADEAIPLSCLDPRAQPGKRLFAPGAQFPQAIRWFCPEALGHLGKKTGQGIYKYDNGKAVKRNPDSYPPSLIDALIEPYLQEAKEALAEGIVADADLVDAGLIFGTGFAPFRGGPLHYLNSKKK